MPFQRRQLNGEKEPDRTQTGHLAPPEPGRAQTEDGAIVGAGASPSIIKAATEVVVTLPGPREPVFDAKGNMAPRWYRFFSELYRRTGGTQDNVNFVPVFRKLSPTTAALSFVGAAPTAEISVTEAVPSGILALAGAAPMVTVA